MRTLDILHRCRVAFRDGSWPYSGYARLHIILGWSQRRVAFSDNTVPYWRWPPAERFPPASKKLEKTTQPSVLTGCQDSLKQQQKGDKRIFSNDWMSTALKNHRKVEAQIVLCTATNDFFTQSLKCSHMKVWGADLTDRLSHNAAGEMHSGFTLSPPQRQMSCVPGQWIYNREIYMSGSCGPGLKSRLWWLRLSHDTGTVVSGFPTGIHDWSKRPFFSSPPLRVQRFVWMFWTMISSSVQAIWAH